MRLNDWPQLLRTVRLRPRLLSCTEQEGSTRCGHREEVTQPPRLTTPNQWISGLVTEHKWCRLGFQAGSQSHLQVGCRSPTPHIPLLKTWTFPLTLLESAHPKGVGILLGFVVPCSAVSSGAVRNGSTLFCLHSLFQLLWAFLWQFSYLYGFGVTMVLPIRMPC